MLDEANRIWKILDDLATNDPAGYKAFIEEQMKVGKTYLSIPVVRFTIKTTLKVSKKQLIINFCEWSAVPEAKTEESPIIVKCGESFEINNCTAIALAFNPKTFTIHDFDINTEDPDECQRYQLVWLGLHYLEVEKKLTTVESSSVLCSTNPIKPEILVPSDCYGSKEQIFTSLGYLRRLIRTKELQNGMSVINQLTNGFENEMTDDYANEFRLMESNSLKLPQSGSVAKAQTQGPLIQEVPSNTVNQVENLVSKVRAMSIPWKAEVLASAEENNERRRPNNLKITFDLPGVKSGDQCELDMTTGKLNLQVKSSNDGFSPLELELPCKVNASEAIAKFNPRRHKLVLTAPILLTS